MLWYAYRHAWFTLFLHILQWVDSWGQDEEHWRCRSRFLKGCCKIQGSPYHVFTAKLLLYKISARKKTVASLLLFRKERSPANNPLIGFDFADSNKRETKWAWNKVREDVQAGLQELALSGNVWHFLQG